MRLSRVIYPLICFILAACICVVGAGFSVRFVEEATKNAINQSFEEAGLTWAHVEADGLQVFVIGDAKDEAERFKAISLAGSVVDAARLIDQTQVLNNKIAFTPEFSLEILKNSSTLSVIGVIPTSSDKDGFLKKILQGSVRHDQISDLLTMAAHTPPANWERALRFSIEAANNTDISRITVTPGSVRIKTMVGSLQEKRALQSALTLGTPNGVSLSLDIAVPRPVISPFIFRAVKLEDGYRLEACSALDAEAQKSILEILRAYDFNEMANCQIGLGMPDSGWPKAIQKSLETLAKFNAGSITVADTEIKLVADSGTPEREFQEVVTRLKSDLPNTFQVQAVLPKPNVYSTSPDFEFVATLSPEGLAQFRGPIDSDVSKQIFQNLAIARFGRDPVYSSLKIAENLPTDWSVYLMAGVEALSLLNQGTVTISPNKFEIRGRTGQKTAQAEITNALIEKLPRDHKFRVRVLYVPPPKIEDITPTATECIAQVNDLLSDRKINFEPGSDRVDLAGHELLDNLATIFRSCGAIQLEIAGHTDSQGREEMNQKLSQSRAQAVLVELQRRRILTSSFVATGYGESQPIASNETEEGRETNRRIEFKLINEPAEPEPQLKEAADE